MNTPAFTAEQAILRNVIATGRDFFSQDQACSDASATGGGSFVARSIQDAFSTLVRLGAIERLDIRKVAIDGDYAYRLAVAA
jgi:hypothetical protein